MGIVSENRVSSVSKRRRMPFSASAERIFSKRRDRSLGCKAIAGFRFFRSSARFSRAIRRLKDRWTSSFMASAVIPAASAARPV